MLHILGPCNVYTSQNNIPKFALCTECRHRQLAGTFWWSHSIAIPHYWTNLFFDGTYFSRSVQLKSLHPFFIFERKLKSYPIDVRRVNSYTRDRPSIIYTQVLSNLFLVKGLKNDIKVYNFLTCQSVPLSFPKSSQLKINSETVLRMNLFLSCNFDSQ